MVSLAWVVLSSVAWVVTDVLRKRLAAPIGAAPLGALLATGSLVAFVPWWLATGGSITPGYALPASLSLLANILASWLILVALHRGELGVVVPLLALTPVLSALGDWLVGGPPPGPRQSFGIGLVVVGALILQMQGKRFRVDSASTMAIAVALLFSMTAVSDGMALKHCPASLHGVIQSTGMAVGLAVIATLRGQSSRLWPPLGTRWLLLATVTAFFVGYGAQLIALEQVPVSLHETVKRAIGILGALIVGAVGFGEQVTVQRLSAVGAILAGVALVLL